MLLSYPSSCLIYPKKSMVFFLAKFLSFPAPIAPPIALASLPIAGLLDCSLAFACLSAEPCCRCACKMLGNQINQLDKICY